MLTIGLPFLIIFLLLASMPALAQEYPVLVGAGDIASCDRTQDDETARLLEDITGTVFTTGDHSYDVETLAEFEECYASSWGRHKARTRPAVGNHDYEIPNASAYFRYFGSAAGEPDKGYYSYDLGDWHIVVLNSNCKEIDGCKKGSEQEQWLRGDLAAHPTPCTLAYLHHPLWSSQLSSSTPAVRPLYEAMYDHGVDVVLTGHAHNYERFLPLDPTGKPDDTRGLRQIVVGTGGRSHGNISDGYVLANSEVRNDDTFGVLRITLRPSSYDWQFIPVAGKTFVDDGSAPCISPDSLASPPTLPSASSNVLNDQGPARTEYVELDSDMETKAVVTSPVPAPGTSEPSPGISRAWIVVIVGTVLMLQLIGLAAVVKQIIKSR